MPDTTYADLRYPASSDVPNVPQYMQNLANDLDQKVTVRVASPTARNALTAYSGMLVYEVSTGRSWRRNKANTAWEYAGGEPPPVVLAPMFGGWTAIPGNSPVVYKDSSGLVHLAGACVPDSSYNPTDGLTHTVITLPAGYRPAIDWHGPVTLAVGLQPHVVARINTSGVLEIVGGTGTSVSVGVAHHFASFPPFHPAFTGGALI